MTVISEAGKSMLLPPNHWVTPYLLEVEARTQDNEALASLVPQREHQCPSIYPGAWELPWRPQLFYLPPLGPLPPPQQFSNAKYQLTSSFRSCRS